MRTGSLTDVIFSIPLSYPSSSAIKCCLLRIKRAGKCTSVT